MKEGVLGGGLGACCSAEESIQGLVSVGIPVYNEEKHLAELLRSIVSQPYPLMEIIISDNASTDNSWEIIQEFSRKDKRIRAIRQNENTEGRNFRIVLEQAKGEYFIWAGGHDIWGKEMIRKCVDVLQEDANNLLCAPKTEWIDSDGKAMNIQEENINTRSANTPTGRVLAFYRKKRRCSAIYGLHRRGSLLQTLPWRAVFGSDFIILVRIAALGNIVTADDVSWYRRKSRQETVEETIQRQVVGFPQITKLASRYPYIVSRSNIMLEFLKLQGSFSEKVKLLSIALRRLFLSPEQLKILIRELAVGWEAKNENKHKC